MNSSIPSWASRLSNGIKGTWGPLVVAVGIILGIFSLANVTVSRTLAFAVTSACIVAVVVVFVAKVVSTPVAPSHKKGSRSRTKVTYLDADSLSSAGAILGGIDRRVYAGNDSFDEEELSTLLRRFPRAVMVLEREVPSDDKNRYCGYISSFPITLEAAKKLNDRPTRPDYALPCTSRDPGRVLFRTSEVPTPSELTGADIAWYVDSIVNLRQIVEPGVSLDLSIEKLLKEATENFRLFSARATVRSVFTISHTPEGRELVSRLSSTYLAPLGFGDFVELWTVDENTCWQAVRRA